MQSGVHALVGWAERSEPTTDQQNANEDGGLAALANGSLSLVNRGTYVSDLGGSIDINCEGDTMANEFSLEGAKWGSPELGTAGGTVTWAVDNTISQTELQSINAAFAEWSEVANIQFQQVASTAESDIDFANSAIDGAGNVLGVTGYSFSGGQLQSAEIQFDSGDNLSGSDFSLVAIHEIGHAIGLGHDNDEPAVMNSTANFDLTGLEPSDIEGIVELYGANTTDVADAGNGATPPDLAIPDDGTGDTGATPEAPTDGCGGTETAAGDGATGAGADGGLGGLDGDLGGRLTDLASLLQSILADLGDAGIAPGADVPTAQPAEVTNVAQLFDQHMWG
jgi:Matrixin